MPRVLHRSGDVPRLERSDWRRRDGKNCYGDGIHPDALGRYIHRLEHLTTIVKILRNIDHYVGSRRLMPSTFYKAVFRAGCQYSTKPLIIRLSY